MTYYLKALVLVSKGGGSYRRDQGLVNTLKMIARRKCRLHWLR